MFDDGDEDEVVAVIRSHFQSSWGRFVINGIGGLTLRKKLDLKSLLEDPSLDEDAENWDALDEEEVEAMKEISSAYNVKSLDDVDVEMYPRFVIKEFGEGPKAVDKLLRVLLPVAKVVLEKQEEEKDSAKAATELRERRELLQQRKKANEARESQQYLMK